MAAPETFLVATDLVLFGRDGDDVYVLLIQRKNQPYQNAWALPGGFLDKPEDLLDGALRELKEETGIVLESAIQVGAYGKPDRDPRGRVISIAFTAEIDKQSQQPIAADDAKKVAWHKLTDLPVLAFDHHEIISEAARRILV